MVLVQHLNADLGQQNMITRHLTVRHLDPQQLLQKVAEIQLEIFVRGHTQNIHPQILTDKFKVVLQSDVAQQRLRSTIGDDEYVLEIGLHPVLQNRLLFLPPTVPAVSLTTVRLSPVILTLVPVRFVHPLYKIDS
jgi:hypothetical protein